MCTHAVLIGDTKRRVKAAGVEEIISTNSIPGNSAKIDLAGLISGQINNIIESENC
jgi:ribose-phosphate pyrophosphokinase